MGKRVRQRQSAVADKPVPRPKTLAPTKFDMNSCHGAIMKSFRLKRTVAVVCVAIGISLVPSLPAYAGNAFLNLGVSANVAANCTIATAPVAFGAYDPVVTNAAVGLTGTGSITVACTKGSVPTINLA